MINSFFVKLNLSPKRKIKPSNFLKLINSKSLKLLIVLNNLIQKIILQLIFYNKMDLFILSLIFLKFHNIIQFDQFKLNFLILFIQRNLTLVLLFSQLTQNQHSHKKFKAWTFHRSPKLSDIKRQKNNIKKIKINLNLSLLMTCFSATGKFIIF
jgi:hypothetical protein